MNPNHSHPTSGLGDHQVLSTAIQESIYPDVQHEFNVTDGGEFLDDAIRMKDQPLCETNMKEK